MMKDEWARSQIPVRKGDFSRFSLKHQTNRLILGLPFIPKQVLCLQNLLDWRSTVNLKTHARARGTPGPLPCCIMLFCYNSRHAHCTRKNTPSRKALKDPGTLDPLREEPFECRFHIQTRQLGRWPRLHYCIALYCVHAVTKNTE